MKIDTQAMPEDLRYVLHALVGIHETKGYLTGLALLGAIEMLKSHLIHANSEGRIALD